jgi:hypothetical protein
VDLLVCAAAAHHDLVVPHDDSDFATAARAICPIFGNAPSTTRHPLQVERLGHRRAGGGLPQLGQAEELLGGAEQGVVVGPFFGIDSSYDFHDSPWPKMLFAAVVQGAFGWRALGTSEYDGSMAAGAPGSACPKLGHGRADLSGGSVAGRAGPWTSGR